MAFLNPLWLWGSLAALGVAVPVAIHLLNRFRQRRIEWAAMELLRRATTVRARRVRLEDILLLILRCLALLLLAIALARPTLLTGSALGARGLGGRTAALIAVDASYSMEHRGVHSRFDRARDAARQVADTLQPGDPVTLVLMGRRPRVLMRNMGYDPEHFAKTLDAAEPLPEAVNVEANLETLVELAGELKGASREAYLISDAQATTWGELDGAAEPLLRRLDDEANTLFLPVAGPTDNVAIVGFDLASGSLRRGSTARYLATVLNTGNTPVRGLTVTLLADGRAVDSRTVDVLGPGETQDVPLFYRSPAVTPGTSPGSAGTDGPVRLTARLPDDAVASDNQRYAVADVRDRLRVLVVDGAPAVPPADPYQGESGFLAAALAPTARAAASGGAAEPVIVDTLPTRSLTPETFVGYDAVVLANVATLPEPQRDALMAYVEGGGGLMMFLGDRIDAGVFNAEMVDAEGGAEGRGLSPVRLERVVGNDDTATPAAQRENAPSQKAYRVVGVNDPHPLARLATSLPREVLDAAEVTTYFDAEPVEGAQTLLRVGDGSPLLIERGVGRGKVMLMTTSANRAWSRLPLNPLYPILMNAAVTRLSREGTPGTLVGEPITFPLSGEAAMGTVVGTSPDPEGEPTPLPVRHGDDGAWVRFDTTDKPGFYQAQPERGSARVAAVNVDATEADVRAVPRDNLDAVMSRVGVTVLDEGQSVADAVQQGRTGVELWWPLALAGLVMLIVEAGLATWFSRRSAVDARDVATPRERPAWFGMGRRAAA